MSIAQNLIGQLRSVGASLDPQRRAAIEAGAAELLESYKALMALQKGEKAPDFELPNAIGRPVMLSRVIAAGPAVVTFYRGQWCPSCSHYLGALEGVVADMTALGAQLLAVSPQTPDNSLSTQEKLHLSFEVLSDVGNVAARRYGLVYSLPEAMRSAYRDLGIDLPRFNGTDRFELPVPATYVVAPDGRIVYAFVETDFTRRPEPAGILAALRTLREPA